MHDEIAHDCATLRFCERKRKRERDWSHFPLRQFGKKEEKQSWDGVARKGMRQKENDFARIKAEERV